MTTHEIARQLLALPDKSLSVSGWIDREGYEMAISQYEDGYILYQQPNEQAKREMDEFYESCKWTKREIEIPVSDEMRAEYHKIISEVRLTNAKAAEKLLSEDPFYNPKS